MATATKAPKKKKQGSGSKPLTFKQLLGRASKHEHFARLLKTAAVTGWLSDENFLTRLTDDEQLAVKDEVKKDSHAKRAEPIDLSKSLENHGAIFAVPALPDTVGPMVEDEKAAGKKVRLTAGDATVTVDRQLFLTMQKRHPDALLYLSQDGSRVIFSEKSTQAVLPSQD